MPNTTSNSFQLNPAHILIQSNQLFVIPSCVDYTLPILTGKLSPKIEYSIRTSTEWMLEVMVSWTWPIRRKLNQNRNLKVSSSFLISFFQLFTVQSLILHNALAKALPNANTFVFSIFKLVLEIHPSLFWILKLKISFRSKLLWSFCLRILTYTRTITFVLSSCQLNVLCTSVVGSFLLQGPETLPLRANVYRLSVSEHRLPRGIGRIRQNNFVNQRSSVRYWVLGCKL